MQAEKIKVLYIGGCSRSGSTLLESMLGQVDGFLATGEMWHIWSRSFTENQLCSCGQPFRQCDFWQQVTEAAFGGMDRIDPAEMMALKASVLSPRHVPLLLAPWLQRPSYRTRLQAYEDVICRLYRAIQKVSGCRVIVDSSKFPHYAMLLGQIPDIDLSVVHLVRDSRATAYSWQRKRVRPEVHWKSSYMDGHGPLGAVFEWSSMNVLLQGLKRSAPGYCMIRYEDFVSHPRETLDEILDFIHEDAGNLDFFVGNHAVRLKPTHTVSGNPARFKSGEVKIAADGEWQEKMARGQKLAVTALTLPLLLNYGYFHTPQGSGE